MQKLTPQQKQGLKSWEKKLRIIFIVFLVWLFVVTPGIGLVLVKVFKVGNTFYYVNAGVIIVLFIVSQYVRYSQRCPNCRSIIHPWSRLISLPKKCHKCGVEFK